MEMDYRKMRKDGLPDKQMTAREQNTLEILRNLSQQKQVGQQKDPSPMLKQEKKKEQKLKQIGRLGKEKPDRKRKGSRIPAHLPSPEVMEKMSVDEHGNFQPPPIEGYWLMAAKDKADEIGLPDNDWRMQAIRKLEQAREKLYDTIIDFSAGVIQQAPKGLIDKEAPEQFKHTPVRGPRRA